ncbi:MAG: Hpt domain-containing protein, partial [Acidobacteriota bacterium]
MDRQKVQSFIKSAGVDLSSVRSSLLIAAQIGDMSDLMGSRHSLARLKTEAAEIGLSAVADMAADCEAALCQLAGTKSASPHQANAALDAVARIEAALWNTPLQSSDFLTDVSEFVDASFDELVPPPKEAHELAVTEFEIDEETLEVFRSEADELLANIVNDLRILSASPDDKNALWDIRRNAHTFKGAAGIVGLKNAAEVAHRMEDLLDKVVETGREPTPPVVEFLILSSGHLASIVAAKDGDDDGSLEKHYADLMATISAPKSEDVKPEVVHESTEAAAKPVQAEPARTTVTPVVRVSLDRLDELVGISRDLLENRADVAQYFAALGLGSGGDSHALAKLVLLFGAQRQMIEEIQAKLLHIRMVKFGTLETRLGRAINVTCLDENKKAALEIDNGDVEIDTQVIDSLIEPLLHLLKNAVVHGIEPPDTRRLIRKPERGT